MIPSELHSHLKSEYTLIGENSTGTVCPSVCTNTSNTIFILLGVYPAYVKGEEHDVLEFLLSTLDCIDRELKL